jgi:hypothetical protein
MGCNIASETVRLIKKGMREGQRKEESDEKRTLKKEPSPKGGLRVSRALYIEVLKSNLER